jgi:phosphatidylinositol alpha-mannosyltransferase
MRIGIVCPYAFDVPGGVQFHVRDLAEHFLALGHDVQVLAPQEADDAEVPEWFTSCGRPVAVPYNGSVARVAFGPVTSARVSRWVDNGAFDVLHIHEPMTPSASVLALWAATDVPIVGTFHTATLRSRAMHAAHPLLRPSMEKIRARIAVSEEARHTAIRHLRGDAYVIPNGVDVDHFMTALPGRRWSGTADRPTVAFLGRIDEPRKGLQVLRAALPALRERHPGVRVLVAGPGEVPGDLGDAEGLELLGMISEAEKAELFASVDAYVAPHIGGESFGIVLVEAMAGGAPVVCSDLTAFVDVLGEAAAGVTFSTGDAADLARVLGDVLADGEQRSVLRGRGLARAQVFDWDVVAAKILAVYETVIESAEHTPDDSSPGLSHRVRRLLTRPDSTRADGAESARPATSATPATSGTPGRAGSPGTSGRPEQLRGRQPDSARRRRPRLRRGGAQR